MTDFRIEAWASPEGEEGHNNELSTNRYNAAEKQIKDLAKGKKVEITVKGGGNGEDIELFKQLVKDSNLKDKDAILNVINSSSNQRQAVEDACRTYERQLEKDILPQIRRAEIMVNEPEMKITTRTIEVEVPCE